MAKTALVAGEQSNETKPNAAVSWITNNYQQGRTFLSDVRGEMRKVITPSRKEVQATTTVVLATVFVFAAFFFVVDYLFSNGVAFVINKLAGPQ
jgi:preprotein translocase subunit SecE